MVDRRLILIVEDDPLQAMNLVAAVEDAGGEVLGPAATVTQALLLLEQSPIAGAILDANLLDRDVTPVALALIDLAVPFIIHTGVGLPDELAAAFPHVSVIMKPASSAAVVDQLLRQVEELRHWRATDPLSVTLENSEKWPDADRIDRITSAFRGQFGDKAVMIARRQAVGATGAALRSWSLIIDRLSSNDKG